MCKNVQLNFQIKDRYCFCIQAAMYWNYERNHIKLKTYMYSNLFLIKILYLKEYLPKVLSI